MYACILRKEDVENVDECLQEIDLNREAIRPICLTLKKVTML